MSGKCTKVRSSDGGEFDCYLSIPKTATQVPAVVLACAVQGVDADLVAIADEFAAHGFIAAAPDLFWRTVPGALSHDDGRAQERSQPRLEKIRQGEEPAMQVSVDANSQELKPTKVVHLVRWLPPDPNDRSIEILPEPD